jgi:hypothetical protein
MGIEHFIQDDQFEKKEWFATNEYSEKDYFVAKFTYIFAENDGYKF